MTEREQLRDRLAALMPWGDVGSFDAVDAILAEIEAAGYVVLERDLAERLRVVASDARQAIDDLASGDGWRMTVGRTKMQYDVLSLKPGDLDPLEGGE